MREDGGAVLVEQLERRRSVTNETVRATGQSRIQRRRRSAPLDVAEQLPNSRRRQVAPPILRQRRARDEVAHATPIATARGVHPAPSKGTAGHRDLVPRM